MDTQQQAMLPPQQETVKGVIGKLVIICNGHIRNIHQARWNPQTDIVDELVEFVGDVDELYLNTNQWIRQKYCKAEAQGVKDRFNLSRTNGDSEIEMDGKTVKFIELCKDIEDWIVQKPYDFDENPIQIMYDGALLVKWYIQALIVTGLFNPSEV